MKTILEELFYGNIIPKQIAEAIAKKAINLWDISQTIMTTCSKVLMINKRRFLKSLTIFIQS